jgi:hypothetical protein
MTETSSSNLQRILANRRACQKRIRNQREGAFFQDVPTQPVMVGKRMIDFACDNFFRSRGMPQKDRLTAERVFRILIPKSRATNPPDDSALRR